MNARRVTTVVLAMTLLTAAHRLHAQALVELRGRVIDLVSGEPVVDAIVRVPIVRRYTLTNADGFFRITDVPRDLVTLQIVHVAYGDQLVHREVRPNELVVIRITPKAIRLDPIVVADTRRVKKLMDDAARTRIWHMTGGPRGRRGAIADGVHVFWRAWDRDRILASGIDEPLRFLTAGPPRLAIDQCVGLQFAGMPPQLCLMAPFGGQVISTGPAFMPQTTAQLAPRSQGDAPTYVDPGMPNAVRVIPPRPRHTNSRKMLVFIDDQPVRFEDLEYYSMSDIHRVETFGDRGERAIRLYTLGYLRLVAAGFVDPDAGMFRDRFEPLMSGDTLARRR